VERIDELFDEVRESEGLAALEFELAERRPEWRSKVDDLGRICSGRRLVVAAELAICVLRGGRLPTDAVLADWTGLLADTVKKHRKKVWDEVARLSPARGGGRPRAAA
jgi:hypothetical protein